MLLQHSTMLLLSFFNRSNSIFSRCQIFALVVSVYNMKYIETHFLFFENSNGFFNASTQLTPRLTFNSFSLLPTNAWPFDISIWQPADTHIIYLFIIIITAVILCIHIWLFMYAFILLFIKFLTIYLSLVTADWFRVIILKFKFNVNFWQQKTQLSLVNSKHLNHVFARIYWKQFFN